MKSPLLSTGHSPAMEKMLKSNPSLIQAVEFTPYTSIADLPGKTTTFQDSYEMFFHPGYWLRFPLNSHRISVELKQYLSWIKPPWVSFHISLKPAWVVWLNQQEILFPLNRKLSLENKLITKINALKTSLPCQIMLEHMPSAAPQDKRECDPELLHTIVKETNSLFLLDIPHAIITAQMLTMPVDQYLSALPLERTREVHISGARKRKGMYYDAHETIGEEEKFWLKWVLDHCEPHLVNLEYHQDTQQLTHQLEDLAKILNP